MEVDRATLQQSIERMPDAELLRRLAGGEFTELARPLAEAEVEKRGIVGASAMASRDEVRSLRVYQDRKAARVLVCFLVGVVAVLFGRLGAIPAILSGLTVWPVAHLLSRWMIGKIRSSVGRFAFGGFAFLLFGWTAGLVSVALGFALGSASAIVVPSVGERTSAPLILRPPEANTIDAQEQLQAIVDAQNRRLPARMSENLELIRIEAGPGLQATYFVRFTDPAIKAETISEKDWSVIQAEGSAEACRDFAVGLRAGITYVTAYHSHDGELLHRFAVAAGDCAASGG